MVQSVSCVICRQDHPNGLFLLDMYICPLCEREMVKTEVGDPNYRIFVQQLKKGRLKSTVNSCY